MQLPPNSVPSQARLSRKEHEEILEIIREESVGLVEHYERPRTRLDCLPGGWNDQRPCPFAGCRHHLYLHVDKNNGSVSPIADMELWELEHTCVLDLVDKHGEFTLEQIGMFFGLTRERIRQIEMKGLGKLLPQASREGLEECLDNDPCVGRAVGY